MMPSLISGVIVPWNKSFSQGHRTNFKLITRMGTEYFIVAGPEWEPTLSWHSWEEVKVRGFLNLKNRTIVPKKIYPKDPAAKRRDDIAVEELDGEKAFDLNFYEKRLNHGYSLEPRIEEAGGVLI